MLAVILLVTTAAFTQNEQLFQKGKIASEAQNYDSATFYFNEFIHAETSNVRKAQAYLELGLIQTELQKPTEGIKLINQAILLDQQYIYYFYRGRLNYQSEKIGQAIKDYDITLQLKPDYGAAYAWRGVAKYWKANVAEGCVDIKKGAELGDEHAREVLPKLCK